MIAVTHLLFALAFAYILRLPVVYVMVAGVLPNVDALFAAPFPFTTQGILHTPLFAGFIVVVLYLVTGRGQVALAAGLGLLSHLVLDSLTPLGAMWLYPVTTHHVAVALFPATDLLANVTVALYSVAAMLAWRYRRILKRVVPSASRVPAVPGWAAVIVLVIGASLAGVVVGSETGQGVQVMTGEQYSVQWLMQERPLDEEVRVMGRVVHVQDDATLQNGERFMIADVGGTATVQVACRPGSQVTAVETGDLVRVTGPFVSRGDQYQVRVDCAVLSPL